jgi:hypothetical protein
MRLDLTSPPRLGLLVAPLGGAEESTKCQFHSTILTHQGLRPNKMEDATDTLGTWVGEIYASIHDRGSGDLPSAHVSARCSTRQLQNSCRHARSRRRSHLQDQKPARRIRACRRRKRARQIRWLFAGRSSGAEFAPGIDNPAKTENCTTGRSGRRAI